MDGWMDGWMDGCKAFVQRPFQQSCCSQALHHKVSSGEKKRLQESLERGDRWSLSELQWKSIPKSRRSRYKGPVSSFCPRMVLLQQLLFTGPEGPARLVWLQEIAQVRWHPVHLHTLIHKSAHFKCDSLFYGKPVELLQHRRDVFFSLDFC